jgi:chromate transporter
MVGPSCVLAFVVTRVWERFRHARWRIAVQNGLVPLSLGLIAASAFVIARTTDHNIAAAVVTALTAVVAYMTRLNPLWLFAAGGIAGFAGLV